MNKSARAILAFLNFRRMRRRRSGDDTFTRAAEGYSSRSCWKKEEEKESERERERERERENAVHRRWPGEGGRDGESEIPGVRPITQADGANQGAIRLP